MHKIDNFLITLNDFRMKLEFNNYQLYAKLRSIDALAKGSHSRRKATSSGLNKLSGYTLGFSKV